MTTSNYDFSHAYQSQVYRPCVIHILPQFSLISFGSWYSGIWHIDHICFAIWIWDWFPEYVSYSVSLSFMLYFFLQYTFDQIKAFSLRSKEQTFFSLSIFIDAWLMLGFLSSKRTHITESEDFLFGVNQSSWTRRVKRASDGLTCNQARFMFFFLLIFLELYNYVLVLQKNVIAFRSFSSFADRLLMKL